MGERNCTISHSPGSELLLPCGLFFQHVALCVGVSSLQGVQWRCAILTCNSLTARCVRIFCYHLLILDEVAVRIFEVLIGRRVSLLNFLGKKTGPSCLEIISPTCGLSTHSFVAAWSWNEVHSAALSLMEPLLS